MKERQQQEIEAIIQRQKKRKEWRELSNYDISQVEKDVNYLLGLIKKLDRK